MDSLLPSSSLPQPPPPSSPSAQDSFPSPLSPSHNPSLLSFDSRLPSLQRNPSFTSSMSVASDPQPLVAATALSASIPASGKLHSPGRTASLGPIGNAQFVVGMPDSSELTERGELKVFDSVDELAAGLADYVAELSEAAVKERGSFAVALSGGSLISALRNLSDQPHLKTIDWSRWHVFWADERVVPRNHPDSNYKLAKEGLLSKVPILPSQVYSINDALSAEAAADDYEFGLRQLVKTKVVNVFMTSDCPRFDLILLGMGPDGHVASLFPHHPLTQDNEKWIAFLTDSPKPPPERITFTFPVINSAANVVFVVTGANKAEVLGKIFAEDLPSGELPAQMVSPLNGKLMWFLDKESASKLPVSQSPSEGIL